MRPWVAGGWLALALSGCELIVGTGDRSLSPPPEAGAPDDAPSQTARDASDSSEDAAEENGLLFGDGCSSLTCTTEATQCADLCRATSFDCQVSCRTPACRLHCRYEEVDCKWACETTCEECTEAIGCYDLVACLSATM